MSQTEPTRSVETLDKRSGFAGYGHLDVLTLRFRMRNGVMSPRIEREVITRANGAAVVPIDVEGEEIILVEQFRAAAWISTRSGWVLECPAGEIAPGETPQTTAEREALEETGCEIADLVHVASVLTNPAALTETVHIFCARITSSDGKSVHRVTEEAEETVRHNLPIAEIGEAIAGGKIRDAKTLIV